MATTQKLRLSRCVQSTNYENNKYPATNAIDGNLNSFNHTNDGSEEWWQVELENPQNVITQIVIKNRYYFTIIDLTNTEQIVAKNA